MKKIAILSAALLLICGLVTGCGAGSSLVGTWYSDRNDQSTLILDKDGTYNNGTWLTNGDYTSDGSEITLTSTLDGTTTLLIKTENGKTVLFYDHESYSLLTMIARKPLKRPEKPVKPPNS